MKKTTSQVIKPAAWILLAVLMSAAAFGDQSPADIRLQARSEFDGRGQYEYYASGTVIYSSASGSWVLTASHNLHDEQTGKDVHMLVVDQEGVKHYTRRIAEDRQLDIALLWSAMVSHPIRPLAGEWNPQDPHWVTGFPHEGQAYQSHHVTRAKAYENHTWGFPCEAIQGQSGGAVVDKLGHLAGVVKQSDGVESYATCGQAVFDFVEKTVGNYRYNLQRRCTIQGGCYQAIQPQWVQSSQRQSRQQQQPRQQAAPPTRPAPAPTPRQQAAPPTRPAPAPTMSPAIDQAGEKIAGLEKQITVISQRVDDMDTQINAIPSPPAAKAIRDEILASLPEPPRVDLEALVQQVIKSLPPVTVNYLDADGKIYDTELVYLGEELSIAPLLVRRVVNGEVVGETAVLRNHILVIDDTYERVEVVPE